MFIRPLYMFASVGVMVLCTVFFLSIMKRGAPERMPVAVVDKDQTSISRRLCHETNATQSVEIVLITPNFADARLAMQRRGRNTGSLAQICASHVAVNQ